MLRLLFLILVGIPGLSWCNGEQPLICVSPSPIALSAVVGGTASLNVSISTNSSTPVTITALTVVPSGNSTTNSSASPKDFSAIAPNQTVLTAQSPLLVEIKWTAPPKNSPPAHVTLRISADTYFIEVPVSGLTFAKDSEPSLQWNLDAFGIAVNVGDDDPSTLQFNTNQAIEKSPKVGPDELESPLFVQAGDSPIRVVTLAAWCPEMVDPAVLFGWYNASAEKVVNVTNVFNVTANPITNAHTTWPIIVGEPQFDPKSADVKVFGLSVSYTFFKRVEYSEDFRNTFRDALPHHIRSFPLVMNVDGVKKRYPHAMVMTSEDITGPIDFNDFIVVIFGVDPMNSSVLPNLPLADTSLSPIQPEGKFCQRLPVPEPVAPQVPEAPLTPLPTREAPASNPPAASLPLAAAAELEVALVLVITLCFVYLL